jgi:hypothetical protein
VSVPIVTTETLYDPPPFPTTAENILKCIREAKDRRELENMRIVLIEGTELSEEDTAKVAAAYYAAYSKFLP